MNAVEIKLIGTEYVAYVWNHERSRGKDLVKVMTKVLKYLKSQS